MKKAMIAIGMFLLLLFGCAAASGPGQLIPDKPIAAISVSSLPESEADRHDFTDQDAISEITEQSNNPPPSRPSPAAKRKTGA